MFPNQQWLIHFLFLCHPFNSSFFDLSPSGYNFSLSFSLIFISLSCSFIVFSFLSCISFLFSFTLRFPIHCSASSISFLRQKLFFFWPFRTVLIWWLFWSQSIGYSMSRHSLFFFFQRYLSFPCDLILFWCLVLLLCLSWLLLASECCSTRTSLGSIPAKVRNANNICHLKWTIICLFSSDDK